MRTDLVLFMGQSNMAGRGEAEKAPVCALEAGWEFRPVSDPGRPYPIREPFGLEENRKGGIWDEGRKKGSLVSSFVNAYHQASGRRVAAVSASEGGTSTYDWLERLVWDAADRLERAKAYLEETGAAPEHIFMVWCQGETDGDRGTTPEQYRRNFAKILEIMRKSGVQDCFLIQIGHFHEGFCPEGVGGVDSRTLEERYGRVREAQAQICREMEHVYPAGSFEGYRELMKDSFHYRQEAYNEVGRLAGEEAARVLEAGRQGGLAKL